MRFVAYILILLPVSCHAWWQPALDPHDPAGTYRTLLHQQVDDPYNPGISYNLGIAASQQKKYAQADGHFSLATELYERDEPQLLPVYFSWADGAAHQLLDVMQKNPNIKGKQLDDAIDRAGRASERYGNVLVLDEDHQPAEERKNIIDKLKKVLEQKKRQEEQQKQEDEQKKEQDKNQKGEGGDSDAQQNKDKQQDKDQQSQDGDDAQENSGQKSQGGKADDASQDGQKEQDKKQSQQGDEQRDGGKDKDEKELDPSSQPSPEAWAGKQGEEEAGNEEQDSGLGKEEEAGKQGEGETGAAGAQTSEQIADEMARRRAVVLLDKLQQDESSLQKQLLRTKSQNQQSIYGRYNQW